MRDSMSDIGEPVPANDPLIRFKLEDSGKGEGVFSQEHFAVGSIVMNDGILEELTANDAHASQIGADRFVRHAGLIPKVNHSCDPNCSIFVDPTTGAHGYIAVKAIKPGDELSFDYSSRNSEIKYFGEDGVCKCGSSNCRSTVKGWASLSVIEKQAIRDKGLTVAPYLLAIDEIREELLDVLSRGKTFQEG